MSEGTEEGDSSFIIIIMLCTGSLLLVVYIW